MEMLKERSRLDFPESAQPLSVSLSANEESESPEQSELRFEGFSEKQEAWVRKLFELSGLPLTRIKLIQAVPGIYGSRSGGVIAGTYNRKTQTITTYPDAVALIVAGPFGYVSQTAFINRFIQNLVHEVAHASSPIFAKAAHSLSESGAVTDNLIGYDKIYSVEDAERLHETTKKKAEESLVTRVYINNYHRWLAEEVLLARARQDQTKAVSAFMRLCIELEAIIVQMRYLNPNHIHQVDAATQKKLGREDRTQYISYFDWGNDILGTAMGQDAAGVRQKVADFQRFVKTEPFPFD